MNLNRTASITLFAALLVMSGLCVVSSSKSIGFAQDLRPHWAWRKPVHPPLPIVKNGSWVKTPIDAFVLARIEAAGLAPAPRATWETLIRRATFDLIGLPPTPDEIDAFIKDRSVDAWEKVVDRLLASPHYGERWGRHWLDLSRFAESNGFEHDEVRPDAWRYRDYVIRSFNSDKPYDRFVKEQIAGDELYPDDTDALIATGFSLLGPDMTDASDQAQRRQNTLNDLTDTIGLTFLGMTIGCARCHDHKFEPIPQTDFYRLQAFFTPVAFRRDIPISSREERIAFEAASKEYNKLIGRYQEEIIRTEAPYRKKIEEQKLNKLAEAAQVAHRTSESQRTPLQVVLVAETARLIAISPQEVVNAMTDKDKMKREEALVQIGRFDGKKPYPLPVAMGLWDSPNASQKTFVLIRGELGHKGDEVVPGFPEVLAAQSSARASSEGGERGGSRMLLANWIASADNPLTARVMVNRIWQHHFGRGIVATPGDFGLRGERPTHPELLNWLATEFVERGWSIKQMHKMMLMSSTYQQATADRAADRVASDEASPEGIERQSSGGNIGQADSSLTSQPASLLCGMPRIRLEGEVIRDSLLAISGRLTAKMGGPGVFPPIPPDALQGFSGWSVSPDPQDHTRRSIYIFARRNLRFPFLEVFDLPDNNLSCPKREQSTTAPQALTLLNSTDVMQSAKALAERVEHEAATTDDGIRRVFRLALGRYPTTSELNISRKFLASSPLSELCRVVFNLNEFVYLD